MGLVDNSEINHGARAGIRGERTGRVMVLGEGAKKIKTADDKKVGETEGCV